MVGGVLTFGMAVADGCMAEALKSSANKHGPLPLPISTDHTIVVIVVTITLGFQVWALHQ